MARRNYYKKQSNWIGIFNIILIFVTMISTIPCFALVYYKTWGKDKVPTTVQSTYVTSVTDKLTGETMNFIEANYYSNDANNGKEVIEIKFNAYSDALGQTIYSRGYQLYFEENNETYPSLYNYDTYNNMSWGSANSYQWGDPFYVDIDDTIYAMKLDGTKTIGKGNVQKTIWNGIVETITLGFDYKVHYDYIEKPIEFNEFLFYFRNLIKSNSNGTGQFTMPVVDLANFLSIYPVSKDGTVSNEKIGRAELSNSYFTMDVNYSKRGMVYSDQSMFGSVAGDPYFNISGVTEDKDYWKAITEYTVTAQDFTLRKSTVTNGHYLSLSDNLKKYLAEQENIQLIINIDLDLFDKTILGLDSFALANYNIKSMKITSSNSTNFTILDGALNNTGLTEITTDNVTITLYDNLEVIIK